MRLASLLCITAVACGAPAPAVPEPQTVGGIVMIENRDRMLVPLPTGKLVQLVYVYGDRGEDRVAFLDAPASLDDLAGYDVRTHPARAPHLVASSTHVPSRASTDVLVLPLNAPVRLSRVLAKPVSDNWSPRALVIASPWASAEVVLEVLAATRGALVVRRGDERRLLAIDVERRADARATSPWVELRMHPLRVEIELVPSTPDVV